MTRKPSRKAGGAAWITSDVIDAWHLTGLGPAHIGILVVLLRFDSKAKPGQSCFPSATAIGRRLGLGERQVRRLISELEHAGLPVDRKNGAPNRYAPRSFLSAVRGLTADKCDRGDSGTPRTSADETADIEGANHGQIRPPIHEIHEDPHADRPRPSSMGGGNVGEDQEGDAPLSKGELLKLEQVSPQAAAAYRRQHGNARRAGGGS